MSQVLWIQTIIASDKDEDRCGVWIDEHARVAKAASMSGSLITTGYSISNEDYIKLYAFLPEEATAHIPLENPMNSYTAVFIGLSVLAGVIGFAVGFAVKNKNGTPKH